MTIVLVARLRTVLTVTLLLGASLIVLSTGTGAAAPRPSPTPRPAEHPAPPPPPGHISKPSDQISPPNAQRNKPHAVPAGGVAPFLTRPYLHRHAVTSVFDHCNPDYSVDGRICDSDGNVALASNGSDPTFSRGYALHPGAGDYIHYDGHNGWDLALNYEPVLAAADGTVTEAGADDGFGTSILIDHGNGFSTRYSHLSQLQVSLGQQVGRGQQIAISGNTGNSTGPHLHFGLYINSSWTAIDPYGYAGPGADPWPADMGDLWITGNPQDPGSINSLAFGPATGSPSLLVNADGHLEAFGRSQNGAVVHSWEDSSGNWGSWPLLAPGGPAMLTAPATMLNQDGRGEVFATGSDGALYHTWQPGWPGWGVLAGNPAGVSFTGQPAAVRNPDGRLEVFARSSSGALWHVWQLAPNSGWSNWESLGGILIQDPSVARNADGHLEAFGIGTDSAIYHTWFIPGQGWVSWQSFGGASLSRVGVALNTGGTLEIFVVGIDRQMYHQWQLTANGLWGGWGATGGTPGGGWQGDPAVTTTPQGQLEVFARGPDNAVWHSLQPNWSAWSSLGGITVASPIATQEQRPYTTVWVNGSDYGMYEKYRDPNLIWSGWLARGGN